jgi:peptidoglycan/LPS O-acetylase OafA/YrhL
MTHLGYFDVSLAATPLNHMWSLAIEEQFYIVWPLLAAVFLNRWRRPVMLGWLAVALAAVSMLATPLVFARFGANAGYLGTETRVGAILVGAALALFAHRVSTARTAPPPIAKAGLTICAVLGAGWLAYACVTASVASASLYRGGLAASSIAELALVSGVALYPGGFLDRLLGGAPIVALGRRSYSLYLWHYPVYVLVSSQWTSLSGNALLGWRIVLTAAATEFTYRLVESPIRRSATPGRRLIAALLIPAALVFGVSFAPLPARLAPANVVPDAFAGTVPSSAANLRIMVAGDSWGLRTAYGLTVMAPPRPAQVFNAAQPSCGIADPLSEAGYAGVFRPTAQCLAWRTKWAAMISEQHPDAVIFNIGNWDQASQQLVVGGPYVQSCDSGFRARYRTQLHQALSVLTMNQTPVFMTNVRDNDGAARANSDCMNSMLTSAAASFSGDGVYLLDLRQRLCGSSHTCPPVVHGPRVYDETGHLYIGTQVDINAWELQAILAHVKPARTGRNLHQSAVPQVPTDALALDADLRTALAQTRAALPDGTRAVSESDQVPASNLPRFLQRQSTTIATSTTSARIRIIDSAGHVLGRVYAYQFSADPPANDVTVAVQNSLLSQNPKTAIMSANKKSFSLTTPSGSEATGFLRAPNLVVFVHLSYPIQSQQAAVNTYLTDLAKAIGG